MNDTAPHAQVFATAHGHLDRIREYVDVLLDENKRLRSDRFSRPEVVCLCGSTRFRAEFETVNRRLTLAACIVLAPGVFGHAEGVVVDEEDKVALDRLHLAKIDLADRVFVVNPRGYVGDSTRAEITYATSLGKSVDYLEMITDDAGGCSEPTGSRKASIPSGRSAEPREPSGTR